MPYREQTQIRTPAAFLLPAAGAAVVAVAAHETRFSPFCDVPTVPENSDTKSSGVSGWKQKPFDIPFISEYHRIQWGVKLRSIK